MKIFLTSLFLFYFLVISFSVLGQEKEFVYDGKILDDQFLSIGGAYVKNMKTGKFAITDTTGLFSMPCSWGDSLIISAMGHSLKMLIIGPETPLTTTLKRLHFQLDEVIVFEFKEWEAFKKDFLELDLPENAVNESGLPNPTRINPIPIKYRSDHFSRGAPHPVQYVLSPLSSINYWTNNNEQQKRIMIKKLNQEKKERIYWEVMQRDNIIELVEVPDSLCDRFIVFCNQHIENKRLNDEYVYKAKIIELYKVFEGGK